MASLARVWTPLAVFALTIAACASDLWINEVLFNPPGAENLPDQYIELRGKPNCILSNTYLIAVEGDTNGNPGSIESVFDLSGQRIGGNGFLVLLQNSHRYVSSVDSTIITNANGPGFGDGGTSTAYHRGKNSQVTVPTASVTYMLVSALVAPEPGKDIDEDNNGQPDSSDFGTWSVLDSIGILDNDGLGDIAYGLINYRRDSAEGSTATALLGTIVPVAFTPAYVARVKNSTNGFPEAWFASDLEVGPGHWRPHRVQNTSAVLARKPLTSLGLPNFKGPAIPGVVVRQPPGGLRFSESGTGSYAIGLNVKAAKGLSIEITTDPPFEVSVDRGRTFGTNFLLKLTAAKRVIQVRGINNEVISNPELGGIVRHRLAFSGDPFRYPSNAVTIPPVQLTAVDDEKILLSELKVNPPGPNDTPYEFVEMTGTPGKVLNNIWFVGLTGDSELNPGTAATVIDLHGQQIGSNGLLLILAADHPYQPSPGTTMVLAPQLASGSSGLPNGSMSFLLVHSTNAITEGLDYDEGDNGKAEKLPADSSIIDSVSWLDGDSEDESYSPARLEIRSGTPDAATRFSTDTNRNSRGAWFCGNLAGTNGESLTYEPNEVSDNFPFGTGISPGFINNSAPQISPLRPYANAVGDSTAPPVRFTVSDAESPINTLSVSVESSNSLVVNATGLILAGTGADRSLSIRPHAPGYSTITIRVTDGHLTSERSFEYAAANDPRGGGVFHAGAADASAAYAIDARWVLLGDDENQRLRIYARTNAGMPAAIFDMNPHLELLDLYPDGTPKEMDIEAATHVGNRIYWIGSHSHANDAELRTNRARIFATDIVPAGSNTTVQFAGRYDYFKADLLNWDSHNEHGRGENHFGLYDSSQPGVDPKDTNGIGFNIEGLAMAPGDTNTAFVSFRAPLVPPTDRIKALIVPVTNFATLAVSGSNAGSARFGAPIELNLGGRGIRSIEGIGTNYLIVAGPPGVASGIPPSDFKLYTWTGDPLHQPAQRSADLAFLNVEAIVALPPLPWTANSRVQLISDSGAVDLYGDGTQAKHQHHREFRQFRSDWIRLGDVTTPQPFISSALVIEGSRLKLRWHSVNGVTYRLQSKQALADSEWKDLPILVTATDAITTQAIEPEEQDQFFRVIVAGQ